MEREKSHRNEAKTSKFDLNIDVDGKGTFKWAENSLKKWLKRRFSNGLGLSCFNFSHPSLEPTLLCLHLLEPLSTNKLIGSVEFLVGRWQTPKLDNEKYFNFKLEGRI